MRFSGKAAVRLAVPAGAGLLPAILLLSSFRTFRALEEQKAVYLRSRAAAVAAHLETLPAVACQATLLSTLSEEESGLAGLAILERASEPAAALEPMWEGKELFRTERLKADGLRIFRAWVPFHSTDGLRIARIDLAEDSAGFLVAQAREHVAVSLIVSLAVAGLSLAVAWHSRRAARLEQRHLQLEHLARVGKMSAALAHEIRNPLGTIKGYAQLLDERSGGAERALVKPILDETGRLESLVNDLLLYGRPPQPQMRAVDWSELQATIREHAEQAAGDRPIRFLAGGAAVRFVTDRNLLLQVLLNLVRNAIEAIPDGEAGEVALKLEHRQPGAVRITVTDDGPGMPAETRGRLFEPFFTTKAFVTGLGLPIARSLVRSLGGELSIEPNVPRGTNAGIDFPDARAAGDSGVEKEAHGGRDPDRG